MTSYDVIVIGAGVVGSMIARALARYRLRTLLLDKAADVGEGTTKANTAIVHAGYDAKPGTLKARLNLAGNAQYDRVCSELGVEFDRCGTYVVAASAEERISLDELYARGRQNGVPGMTLIDGAEMRRREPSVTPQAVGALYAATGGIVDPFGLCIAAAECAVLNGVELALETEVTGIVREGRRVAGVEIRKQMPGGNLAVQKLASRWVVIAAGLWADDLLHSAGLDGLSITPRKGEYYVLDRVAAGQVHTVLFPCPTAFSKGILVTRTIHGNVMLGPNSVSISDKDDLACTREGLDEVMQGALKLVPGLDRRQIIRTFAGLRATQRPTGRSNTGDFVIEVPREVDGLLLCGAIESPGLAAAPAIAAYVVDLLRGAGLTLVERPDYDPTRPVQPRFSHLSREEQQALIARDPRHGNIVCRCETVTEGEIVAACHAPIPARTYDALKRRTRLGTGRCQGGFDTPLAIEIMARELGVSPLDLTLKGGGSRLVTRQTKAVA